MTQLQPGIILDERYRILELLGEGGFGITYAAENIRIGTRVAIKEFFWRGYVKREEKENGAGKVTAADPADAENFSLLKRKFLQEARILRDFDQENSIVHILDYFEANGTAYMVMEYLDGMTLRRYVKEYGVLEPEDLFRKMLPLVRSLSYIHETGIIHRDISPDNIMVLSDGSLKLLDFGAARKYRDVAGGQYTAIARDNYAPPEQYDRNGRQGPWTDVYALCATMYECVAGKAPDGAVQRMFLDELKSPSQMDIPIEKAYESVIMKGLSMEPDDRWASMDELSREMEAALPEPEEEKPAGNKFLRRFLPIACAAAAVLIILFAWHQYDITHKFRNVETERFVLYAPASMTADEFAQEQTAAETALTAFAGADNYEMTVDGSSIHVLLPLSCFEGHEINTVIEDRILADSRLEYEAEIKADWEDAERSVLAGENQCRFEELDGLTVTQVFACESDFLARSMTKGEWSNLVTDMKVRLDALDTPYAFGTLYGNDRKIVVSLPAEKTGQAVNLTLGDKISFQPRGTWDTQCIGVQIDPSASTATILPAGDGTYELQISPDEEQPSKADTSSNPGDGTWALKIPDKNQKDRMIEMAHTLTDSGEETVYLFGNDAFFASGKIGSAQEDGVLVFDTFYLPESEKIGEERLFYLQYLCALINETSVPVDYSLQSRNFRDETGALMFRFDGSEAYGLNLSECPLSEELRETVEQISTDGYTVQSDGQEKAWIVLNVPADETFLSAALSGMKTVCETYRLSEKWGTFYFVFGSGNGKLQMTAAAEPDEKTYGSRQLELHVSGNLTAEDRQEIEKLWNGFRVEGFTTLPFESEEYGEG